jgi:hypothetical protein
MRPTYYVYLRPVENIVEYFNSVHNQAGQIVSRKSSNQSLDFLGNYAVTR